MTLRTPQQSTESSVLSWEDCSCIERGSNLTEWNIWVDFYTGTRRFCHHSFMDDKVLTLENQT